MASTRTKFATVHIRSFKRNYQGDTVGAAAGGNIGGTVCAVKYTNTIYIYIGSI
jgi:hypothetical protein